MSACQPSDQVSKGESALLHHDDPLDMSNNTMHESDDERINQILLRAKLKAGLLENQSNSIHALVTGGGAHDAASSDCASSITLGKNWIRLDDQQESHSGTSKSKNSILSRPIRISDIENQLFKQKLKDHGSNPLKPKLKNDSIQAAGTLPTNTSHDKIKETNFDKVLEIKQRQISNSASTSKLNRRDKSMDWHDLPVQELTKEVKMEIQAMRLHRTLDPKSFIKGGIEKATKEPIPNRFLFGYVTGGDGSIDGSVNTSISSIKKRSFVESLLQDDKSQEWSKKKYGEVQASGRSGIKHATTKKSFKKRN